MKKSELRQIIKEVISEQMVEWRDGGASAELGKFSAEAERISKASKNASEIELKKKAEEEAAKKAKKGTPKYKEIFNSLFRDVIYLNDKATMSKSEFNKTYGNVDPRKKTHYTTTSKKGRKTKMTKYDGDSDLTNYDKTKLGKSYRNIFGKKVKPKFGRDE